MSDSSQHANFWGGVVGISVFILNARGGVFSNFIKLGTLLRAFVFPLILGLIYLAQMQFPWLFKQCALWSAHPRWWQFFTNGFLSGNPIHLIINMCGLWFVCSQFAPRVRISFLFVYFFLFSAASSFLYFKWAMPPHATLVGASSGVYSLLGFLSWFLRRDRVGFFGLKFLSAPILPFMAFMLILEFFAAKYWIPVLAWQLHLIAFGLSISTALLAHATYSFIHWLASKAYRSERQNSVETQIFMMLNTLKAAVLVAQPALSED